MIKFIPEIEQAWKYWSVQLITLMGALELCYTYWEEYNALIPEEYHLVTLRVLMAATLIARVIRQNNVH